MFKQFQRWLLLSCALAAFATLVGCTTSEPENDTARPWNQPKTWETGLPPGMTQGR